MKIIKAFAEGKKFFRSVIMAGIVCFFLVALIVAFVQFLFK
ncbi:hypothetical protein [Alkalihalobacillus sp. CinArs1]|nr:hypothetical protein [Alkalihalobacillus sp. CinArs1]